MKRNAAKDCLNQYRSALLLTEVLAEKAEQIADTLEAYPVTVSHARLRDEVLRERQEKPLVLVKPQTSPGTYTTKTNGRGGNRQIVVSKKQEEWSYNGIDI
jgi:hypothetical protein